MYNVQCMHMYVNQLSHHRFLTTGNVHGIHTGLVLFFKFDNTTFSTQMLLHVQLYTCSILFSS